MTIIKIYMSLTMCCCYCLAFFRDKENIFKSMVVMSLWFISFSILYIIKEMGY